jgi:hypothetical protein
MVTSADLKLSHGQLFMRKLEQPSMLLSALLSVIHPNLYSTAKDAMQKLHEDPRLGAAAAEWPSVFSGLQVISNRLTPHHRDFKSRCSWYDILCSVGPYTDASLSLSNLGVKLEYKSGSVVAIGGRIVQHGVEAYSGERVCFAYFMRANVHERLRVPNASWSTMQGIRERFM